MAFSIPCPTLAPSLGLLMLFLATPSYALMGGSGIDANTVDSPWAGVVSISPSQGGTFSGALIGDQYVLTAAHVVYGNRNTPGGLIFNINHGGNLTQRISAESVAIHPSYTTGNTAWDSKFAWNDDVAVVKLSSPVAAGVPIYPLYAGPLALHDTLTFVAYGAAGDGATGAVTTPGNPSVKRVGMNKVDALLPDVEGSGRIEVLLFDFDGPDATSNFFKPDSAENLTLGSAVEAQYAGGDSGSPIFVKDHGVWKISGIGAFNGGNELVCDKDPLGKPIHCVNTKFGSIGGGMVVAPYVGWIQSQMAPPAP